ncbi:Siderophore biosynthesis diaminobutyrate--2-oxoglutarate aminotransferase [Photobacterium marinum]|uniref:Siderophore biosynthesis diaminobutyrate--2-oxoglutarate aminotransferase n=1 Tax=Photobacterium marinum TaxID=1056511 RepID=L8JFR3_9GAMM|nr:diaminobutyrate--2-oxoglutarate transaminase family protein [Photobacterium marinum]ELR66242.1 Siderophore biosynthesis diaminobutyrate--2-oxoglutarate aminotransferase [Photobacterium marinum]
MDANCSTETTNDLLRQYEIESNARTYSRVVCSNITAGTGSVISDNEENYFIDCLAGAGTLALGHNHPAVIKDLKEFLNSGQILHGLDFVTPIKRRFSETVLSLFPSKWRDELKMHYCGPSGADATEAAIKLFKTATGRRSVIAFHGAYHGMTNGSMSLTGNTAIKEPVPNLMPDVHFLPFPYQYRSPYGVDSESTIDVSLHHIRSTLSDPNSGITKPAAVIVEAIQGEGGCIPAPARWLKGLSKICKDLDIPLILDEIQSGIGRTGDMFAFEESGIQPDAILISKAVGGGLPMSLVVYNRKYDSWAPGAHTGTFRGNQLAMVAGCTTLDIIKGETFLKKCREKGMLFKNLLYDLQSQYKCIGDVRGRGLMLGIELVYPYEANELGDYLPDGNLAKRIKKYCFDHGLIIETGGRDDSVIRFLPPLNIKREEIIEAVRTLEDALHNEQN